MAARLPASTVFSEIDPEHLVDESVKPRRGGSVRLMPTPMQWLDRLAALIAPPRKQRHRYHGALAPNSLLRAAVSALAQPAEIAVAPTPVEPILLHATAAEPVASQSCPLRLGAAVGAHLRAAAPAVSQVRWRAAGHRLHHRSGGDPGDSRSPGRA